LQLTRQPSWLTYCRGFKPQCRAYLAIPLFVTQTSTRTIILMDFNLPDIDGIETTRRLKAVASSADIPVIMITGQSGKELVVDSLKAGASDFLVKPFDKSTLQTKMQKLLGS